MLRKISALVVRVVAKYSLGRCGGNFRVGYSSHIKGGRNISVGDNFFAGPYLYLNTNKISEIIIGDDVMCGPFVKIISGNHVLDYKYGVMCDAPRKELGYDKGIRIDDDVWIGAGSIILDGGHISEGVVVGAGSVVTKKLPPYGIYAGNPARFIRLRFSAEDLAKHLLHKGSKLSVEAILDEFKQAGVNVFRE